MDWRQTGPDVWELAATGEMLVPARIYASPALFTKAESDRASQQVMNVAHLPGIVSASMAMPDIHWGYGFPIGGVAATDVAAGGVVSPGGVGFDICCGVRLLASRYGLADWEANRERVMNELSRRIPRGLGKGAIAKPAGLLRVLESGAAAVLEDGYGTERDLDRCEERGTSAGADPAAISDKARRRGLDQLGSLGAGNHFLEVQLVERLFDTAAAAAFGLEQGMVCV
ncbi:MAG: RtcB family protein, partial [Acidimicrobiia bacterium]|nr:RtcB family protein [Acidimicrobiia bacterium]